jgi:hypothetical protein
MLSAPTASGRRSASQRDALASMPPAASNAGGPPTAPAAEPHEHDVALADLDTGSRRLELLGADRMARSTVPRSSSTPRAISGGIVSVPSAVKPRHVWTLGSIRIPPCISMFSAWWQSASMCVPECSVITSSADALVRASPVPGSWRRCRCSSTPGSWAGCEGAPAKRGCSRS